MKFTGFTLSLALTSMVSAAAIPALPGTDGVVGGLEGAAEGIVAGVAGGHLRRQLEVVQPVTEGVASSLNGGTGIVGSAVGTVESTGQGAVGTAESTVSGTLGGVKRQLAAVQPVTEGVASSLNGRTGIVGSAVGTAESTGRGAVGTAESTVGGVRHVKRQLEVAQPVTEGVASSLNGGTGIVGSAVGTAESTGQGAVGTVESFVAGVGSGMLLSPLPFDSHLTNYDTAAKRQLGNLPATASQTGTDLLAGLSGSMSTSHPH